MNGGRGRYGVLLCATVASLVVQGALAPTAAQRVAVTVLAATALLLAFRAARLSRGLILAAAVLAAAAVVVSVLEALSGGVGEGAARVMNAAVLAFGPPAVAVGVVRDLRATREVRLEAVMGALALYLLLGMLFGGIYAILDRLDDAPFFAGGEEATVARSVYFSFTTLTTTGYGDLTAGTDPGRTIAILEALLGQLYLVTIVSLIVSNLGRSAGDRGLVGRPPR